MLRLYPSNLFGNASVGRRVIKDIYAPTIKKPVLFSCLIKIIRLRRFVLSALKRGKEV